ncbi:MAG: hypothetical protein Q7K42_03580, partial [Candidatus Diapherotrites archaeon]|nr:hypothetical protein [Candidatus Diapherotrites archaeon]
QSSERARLRKAIDEFAISGRDETVEKIIKGLSKVIANARQVIRIKRFIEKTINERTDLNDDQKEKLILKYTHKLTIAELDIQLRIYEEQLTKAIRANAIKN